jgi:tripartite-type tricarboxylate transporter receptor subunit TctC
MNRWSQFAAVLATGAMVLSACGAPQQNSRDGGGDGGLPTSVNLMVPYSAGGGTDTWARFVAPYIEKHLEGEPSVLVENVPGGESITGTNKYVTDGDTSGETLLVTTATTYFQDLLKHPSAKFDFSTLRPLMVNGTGGVVYASSASGIKTVKDLVDLEEPAKYAGISATGLDLSMLQAADVLGAKIEPTFGFEGRGPARLALERGEVDVDYQTTSAYLSQVEPLVEEGKAVPLFTFGMLEDGEVVRDPTLKDIPTLEEVYEEINGSAPEGPGYDAYRSFLIPGYVYQKGIWANEGTSDEVVEAFNKAAAEIAEDSEFVEKAEDVLGGYPLLPGNDASDELTDAFNLSDDTRQYALDMLEDDYGVTVETK